MAAMYLQTSNPNALIPESNIDRAGFLKGDVGIRQVPKYGKKAAFYNPNNVNPNKIVDKQHSPLRDGSFIPAGVSTNYGVAPNVNRTYTDPVTGEAYQVESGAALFAIGTGTGA